MEIPDIFEYLSFTANLISISKFRNTMILKGGSALISKMIENNRLELYRKTTDIDIHCAKKEIWIDFYTNIENILNNNARGYKYTITKRRSAEKGLNDSDSLTFSLYDPKINTNIKFKIDMNIKSNSIITCEYSPILNMMTYDVFTMLSDKIVVISSEKIYRRIKDLYDLNVLISMYNIDYTNLIKHLKVKHPEAILNNIIVQENYAKLEHAFSKYSGIRNKPSIYTLINAANTFLQPIYNKYSGRLIWSSEKTCWVKD